MLRRHFIVLSMTVALAATIGLHTAAHADDLKKLHIGYQKAGVAPAVKQRGTVEAAFRSVGIDVTWVEFAFGPPLLEALNTGNIDYGFAGDLPPIFAQAASANLLYVAALPTSGFNEAIIVPPGSPIRALTDLRSRRIGFGKGSSAHNMTLAALEKAGIAYSDITPVYLAPADAVAAFAQGSLDAWTIWDPYLALAERDRGARVLVFAKEVHSANSFALANREFTARHPEVVAKLNQIFAQETQWADQHRAEVAQSLHDSTGVGLDAVRRAIDRSRFEVRAIDEQAIANQQAIAERFYKLGLIPKPIAVRDIVWKWMSGS